MDIKNKNLLYDLTEFFYDVNSKFNKSKLFVSLQDTKEYCACRLRLYAILKEIRPALDIGYTLQDYPKQVYKKLIEEENVFAKVLMELKKMEEQYKMNEESYLIESVTKKRRTEDIQFCEDTTSPLEIDYFSFHICFLPLIKGDREYKYECFKWESAWLYVRFMHLPEPMKQEIMQQVLKLELRDFKKNDDGSINVPFYLVRKLVVKRLVHFWKGMANVPPENHFIFVINHFETKLSRLIESNELFSYPKTMSYLSFQSYRMMANCCKAILTKYRPRICKTDFDASLENDFLSETNSIQDGINQLKLETMNTKLFPLCMQQIVEEVQKKSHTKYGARLQLNIFFKSIGLPYREAVRFWMKHFCSRISEETFKKQYLYQIQHIYGLRGSKCIYRQKNCDDLMNDDVMVGCPFKNLNDKNMREALKKCSNNNPEKPILQDDVEGVMNHYYPNNFTKACSQQCAQLCDVEDLIGYVPHITNPAQFYCIATKFQQ